MRYILDSSVAFKWGLNEAESDLANRLRDEFRQGMHELLSPDILPIEIGHAFTRAERQNRLTQSQSLVLWSDIMTTPPKFIRSIPLMPRALAISSQMRVGIYDCLYVAAAELECCEMLTADEKLIKSLPGYPIIPLSILGT